MIAVKPADQGSRRYSISNFFLWYLLENSKRMNALTSVKETFALYNLSLSTRVMEKYMYFIQVFLSYLSRQELVEIYVVA